MISVIEALNIISANQADYGTQIVSLPDAYGGCCAAPVIAGLTMPPFDASAMDGYAVQMADAVQGTTLTVIGEAPAGTPFDGKIGQGDAVRIFTGGPVPQGADTIVIQENVTRAADVITIQESMKTPRHIRRAGIDFLQGETLIKAGTLMGPAEITLAASGNQNLISIYRRPKVAIIANGDELRPPGSQLKSGQIVSSNSAGLAALVRHWGGDPIDMGIAQDNIESIAQMIKAANDADIIIPIGGASVGDYDYMKQAFESLGFQQSFSKVAVKPGKPVWFGTLGKQRILGLPGNPASANVCAHLFLKPLLGRENKIVKARVNADIAPNGPRETYLRGRLYVCEGRLTVEAFPRQDSSLTTPLAKANALIRLLPDSGPWTEGDMIEAIPLGMGPDIL